MKTMNCARPCLEGIFTLMSLCLISADLIALGGDVRVSTVTEQNPPKFSSGLSANWPRGVWPRASEIEIVKEHKGTVLTLRSYQSNVAMYKKNKDIEDEQ